MVDNFRQASCYMEASEFQAHTFSRTSLPVQKALVIVEQYTRKLFSLSFHHRGKMDPILQNFQVLLLAREVMKEQSMVSEVFDFVVPHLVDIQNVQHIQVLIRPSSWEFWVLLTLSISHQQTLVSIPSVEVLILAVPLATIQVYPTQFPFGLHQSFGAYRRFQDRHLHPQTVACRVSEASDHDAFVRVLSHFFIRVTFLLASLPVALVQQHASYTVHLVEDTSALQSYKSMVGSLRIP